MFFSWMYEARQAFWGVAIVLFLALIPGRGQADLSVAPTLVELDSKKRSHSLLVINSGDETQTYRIALQNYQMDEKGQLSLVETATADENFAHKLIRYSPRQVTLKPREAQTVRVLFRRPSNLEVGEYRSHLMFRRVPAPRPATPGREETQMEINIEALFGVAVPVVIHHGDLSFTADITQLELQETENGKPALSMRIDRTGNRSVRGDLSVKADGEEVARINNLAIYPSVPYRQLVLPLTLEKDPRGRTFVIELHKRHQDGGDLIARSEKVFP